MPSIGKFLISKLRERGINHIFAVPGDYYLNWINQASKEIQVVGSTDEQCSGFAADAYARVNGIGCVGATYCVGGFKLINSVAAAYAEKSPVVVISGSPGIKERSNKMLLHHAVGDYNNQLKMFEKITCASTVLDNPVSAGYEIDRVLQALDLYKQPVYIEIPRDMVDVSMNYDAFLMGSPKPVKSDKENLEEALHETINLINSSQNPVILAGIELARFGFGEAIAAFAKKYNIPVATTLLSKGLINENSNISLGVYCGHASNPEVRSVVEKSDCLIMLGVLLTDVNFGFQSVSLKKKNIIFSTTGKMTIHNHSFDGVLFQDFVGNLLSVGGINVRGTEPRAAKEKASFVPTEANITVKRLFDKINSSLDKNMAVIADVGDSLFGSSELVVHHSNHFLAQAFYTSMGFSVPAALGVQLAQPKVRPLVLVGDGAFQMTGMELSTIANHKLNPIVVVLNNRGYTTERFLLDGSFNDIPNWEYHLIPKILGKGSGYLVNTERDLDVAFSGALASEEFTIINVILGQKDKSNTLERMTSGLQKII